MTYELRVERVLDALPEFVFDVFLDSSAQEELFAGPPDSEAVLLESDMDLRVGGTWLMVFGQSGQELFRLTYVVTELVRPHRISATFSLDQAGNVEYSIVDVTFQERDGKTLLTLVQRGFETEQQRDMYLGGAPYFLERLERAVAVRAGQ
jgi:uncharacterized protein YndB with AHSA1/START domain